MEFSEVVRRRRIVRHFAPDPIDRATLERIAATAQRAPSAGFSQGQRVVIVTDADRRRRLAELAGEAFYRNMGFDPWISEAPAASQRRAVSTSSSRVVGSCGTSALVCSAPVGATVMRVPAVDDVVMASS